MNAILLIGLVAVYALIAWIAWWKVPRALAASSFDKSIAHRLFVALFVLFIFGSIPGLAAYLYRVNSLRSAAKAASLALTPAWD